MKKRVISFVLTVNFLFLLLFGRLFTLTTSSQSAAAQSGTRVKTISSSRGFIYDRNLEALTNDSFSYVACIKPTAEALKVLRTANTDDETLRKVSEGYLTLSPVKSGDIFKNCDDIKTLSLYNRYTTDTALHIIGYTDRSSDGVCGIEKYYNSELLSAGGTLEVVYSADANGRMLTGESVQIRSDGYYDKSGIVLTLDKTIQAITEKALQNGNINKGAAVVLDVKSGGILACASTPVYDRNNLADYVKSDDSPFVNKAFCAYPVGSVFKAVTVAAALENGINITDYTCTGKAEKNGNTFFCSKLDGHGKLDLNTATALSCNPFFIELGTTVGGEKLLQTAENCGFGKSIDLGNGNFTYEGVLPDITELNSDAAVGNFAFGQGKLTATPLQIAALFSTVANGGTYNEPYLVKGTADKDGAFLPEIHSQSTQVLKESTCEALKTALAETTLTGTGKSAFSSLFKSCTKTATAQSGQYDKSGNEIKFCWFAGFFPYDNPKYVVCILKENGVSGGNDGGPVFKEISENIYINDIKKVN